MNLQGVVKCPGCGIGTKIKFKAPMPAFPTVTGMTCSGCESELLTRFEAIKGAEQIRGETQLKTMIRFTRPSKMLRAIQKEEEEAALKEPPELTTFTEETA